MATINYLPDVPVRWKQYAAGAERDLVADSPDGQSCARLVVPLADGDFTVCKDFGGTNRPLTGLKAGYQHLANVSAVHSTVAFIAYF
jgi:hypothetical protein